ncbi:MAG: hypothetical protein AB8E87_13640 [Prochlorococcus sp.]
MGLLDREQLRHLGFQRLSPGGILVAQIQQLQRRGIKSRLAFLFLQILCLQRQDPLLLLNRPVIKLLRHIHAGGMLDRLPAKRWCCCDQSWRRLRQHHSATLQLAQVEILELRPEALMPYSHSF